MKQVNPMLPYYKEALKISIAFTLGLILYHYTMVARGYWTMLTILLIYAVPMSGLALRKAKDRIIGTSLGIIGAFFYGALIHWHYQFSYLLILLTIPAFFYAPIKNYYSIGAFFITIIVVTVITIFTTGEANLDQLMAERLFYTMLGVVIVVFCEALIFPRSTQVGNQIDTMSESLCQHYCDFLDSCYENLNSFKDISESILSLYENLISKYTHTKDMYYAQIYELRYDQKQNLSYTYFFKVIDDFVPKLACLMSLARNSHYTSLKPKELRIIQANIKLVKMKLKAFHKSLGAAKLTQNEPLVNEYLDNTDLSKYAITIIKNLKELQWLLQPFAKSQHSDK